MIYGIGIDIVEISRIKKCVQKWGIHFFNKIFSQEETEYFKGKRNPYPHIAGRFAAKESVIKALGALPDLTGWKDIEIKRESSGKPFIVFSPFLMEFLKKDKNFFCHLSISHTKNYAVAQVILEIYSARS